MLYGFYNPDSFEYFYRYASLINILISIGSFYLLYLANKKVGQNNYLSFLFSFGLLGLYQINSYSYHLGSTIWNICSSCLVIFCINNLEGRKRDIGWFFAILSGYPSLLFWFIVIINDLILKHKIFSTFNKGNWEIRIIEI